MGKQLQTVPFRWSTFRYRWTRVTNDAQSWSWARRDKAAAIEAEIVMFKLILTASIISLLAACSSMSEAPMSRSSGMPDTAVMGGPGVNEANELFGPNGILNGW